MSLDLDVRRKKSNGLYPLKIRIYNTATQKNRYYGTGYDMDLSAYKKVFESSKPKRREREIREEVEALLFEYERYSPFEFFRVYTFLIGKPYPDSKG